MTSTNLKQRLGEQVTEFFIVKDIETRNKRTDNSPFLVLELGYSEGRIWTHVWENTEEFLTEYKSGDIVKVMGFVEKYKDLYQINLKKIRKAVASDDVYPEDLLPKYGGQLKELDKRLKHIIKSIKDKYFKSICEAVLHESPLNEKFRKAPAGKLWHHGYIGGLLEHTIAVTELAGKIADQYPDVNRDLLTAAALLHDVGKVDSYSTDPSIEYTDKGRLLGHIVIGYEIVKDAIKTIEDFPPEHEKQLLHLILSHQGEHEKQSPVVPMTKEAVILHFADEIDSNLNAFDRITKEQKTDAKKWSNYVNLIDRFIYFERL